MRLALTLAAVTVLGPAPGWGQAPTTSAAAPVQIQFDAYNRHDAGGMAQAFAPVFYRGTLGDTLRQMSRDTLSLKMGEFFKRAPRVHAKLLDRKVHGVYVIDHEHVTGLPEGKSSDWIMIYEVRDGRILRNWVIPPPGDQD